MLIRFVLNNVLSFGEQKEFNMIPNKKLKTLKHHIFSCSNFKILKLASLYGANGAGKSNLIKSLELFQDLVVEENIPYQLKNSQFKFNLKDEKQTFAIEFVQDNTPFYYGIELSGDIILTEELYLSGLGKKEDKLIFERKTDKKSKKIIINFLEDFENDEKSQVLKTVLLEEFIKPGKPIFKLISNRDNVFLKDVNKAFNWFQNTLIVISPDSRPIAMVNRIEKDNDFKNFAEKFMSSFNIGISKLNSDKKSIEEALGEENDGNIITNLINKVESSPNKMIGLQSKKGEIIIVKENDNIWVKKLMIEHTGRNEKTNLFNLEEESDGTVRLLDFVPAFRDITTSNKVIVIDEIERSIHPLLIKKLVKKFSLDEKAKGQLIFTTHESNLLDQEIFRQDEIWFVEKDKNGATDLYSLNDFKEHKTIDIRKGYLNGRYGSIPFLGNLQDLNWYNDDTDK